NVRSVAAGYLKPATDVLRLVAAFSGADPALQFERVKLTVAKGADHRRWHGAAKQKVDRMEAGKGASVELQVRAERFRVAKLPRPLRRALLQLLEGMHRDGIVEDMLRHRSTWEWLGQH